MAYKETVTRAAQGVGRFVRQSGGRGQYGHVVIDVEPASPASGFEFVDAIVGGVIPREFISSIKGGVEEAMENGVLAGYPMTDVKVVLKDGSYHEVDSSELAFKIAGSMAFRDACKKASAVILEPVMSVEVIVPDDFMGDVIADLNARRGRIKRMETRSGVHVLAPRRLWPTCSDTPPTYAPAPRVGPALP